jgi:hypothetical protein
MTAIINGSSPSVTFSDGTTQSTAFGGSALAASPYTTSLGASTLVNNTGTSNTAIGNSALANNTSGSNNTAVGYQAMYSNTSAPFSAVVGTQAAYSMYANTSGYVSALGYQAGYSYNGADTFGSIFVGYKCGYATTTATNNSFLGASAGVANTTGSSNCFVGAASGSLVTTGSKNTIIGGYTGNNGGLDIRTASNYIVLSDGDGNPRAYWDNAGKYVQNTNTNFYQIALFNNTNNISGNGTIQSSLGSNNSNTNSYHFIGNTNGTDRVYLYGNGNIVNANNSYGTLSDVKLKENIVDATPKLDKILQLQVRNFNLKSEPDLKQIGFIAQEFEKVFPSMVDETQDRAENGSMLDTYTKSIKTSVLVPILVKAIQELKAEVDSLKAQLGK